jgi:hypothetical protein
MIAGRGLRRAKGRGQREKELKDRRAKEEAMALHES